MKKLFSIAIIIAVLISFDIEAFGFFSTGIKELIEVVSEHLIRVEAKEFVNAGGRAVLKEVIENAEKIGGRELAVKAAILTQKYGSRTIRVITKEPEIIIPALEKLPEHLGKRAIDVINRNPDKTIKLIKKYGDEALEVLVRHRGTGELLFEKFGKDGIKLGKALPEELGVRLLQESDEINNLPAKIKQKAIKVITNTPDKVASYIERHPKATLLAAAVYFAPELGEILAKETGNIITHITDSIIGVKRYTVTRKTSDGKLITENTVEGLMSMKNLGIVGYTVSGIFVIISIYFVFKTIILFRSKKKHVKKKLSPVSRV